MSLWDDASAILVHTLSSTQDVLMRCKEFSIMRRSPLISEKKYLVTAKNLMTQSKEVLSELRVSYRLREGVFLVTEGSSE